MNTELLQENRSQGWACATSAPPRFAARIIEIRQALADKKPIPQVSAEYRSAAAIAYRPTVRNIHSQAPLSMRELLAKAARQAVEINAGRYEHELAAARFSNRVDDMIVTVKRGGNPFEEQRTAKQTLRCGSLTSSREDHEYGVEAHANIARRLCTEKREDGWAARADAHFGASEAHRAAAADPTPDNCGKAVVACQRCAATSEKDDE
jgi:hypothetical protein